MRQPLRDRSSLIGSRRSALVAPVSPKRRLNDSLEALLGLNRTIEPDPLGRTGPVEASPVFTAEPPDPVWLLVPFAVDAGQKDKVLQLCQGAVKVHRLGFRGGRTRAPGACCQGGHRINL